MYEVPSEQHSAKSESVYRFACRQLKTHIPMNYFGLCVGVGTCDSRESDCSFESSWCHYCVCRCVCVCIILRNISWS